jgi:hypothetical protein
MDKDDKDTFQNIRDLLFWRTFAAGIMFTWWLRAYSEPNISHSERSHQQC